MNFEIAETQEIFHALFETMHEGFAIHEVIYDDAGNPIDCCYLDVNLAFECLTGLTRDSVVGRRIRERQLPMEGEWIEVYCAVAATGNPAEFENYEKELDRYYRSKVYSPVRGKLVVVFEDITEQKKAVLELTRREEQLRVIFDSSIAGIIMVDASGRIITANNRMAEMLGYSMDELLQTRYPDLVHPDQRTTGDDRMRRLIVGEIDHVATERRYIRKDGSYLWGYLSGRRLENSDGSLISLVGHITDITARIQSEDALLEEKNKSEAIIAALGDGISIQDRNYKILYQNEIHKGFVGSHAGELCFEAYECRDDICEGCPVKTTFMDGKIHCIERSATKNGEFRYFEITTSPLCDSSGSIIAGIELVRDITGRKRAEEERLKLEQQLLHAQKLESLGVLAGGIAHDFNNILMAIIGNADLALMRMNPESPAVENLHRIEKAAAQAADLARQMLAYSGKGKFMVENIDLNRLLEEMLHMLEVSISKNAVLRLNLHKSLPPVEADATQMRQIVMNMVINASEAIGEKSGVIAITTGCMDCDRRYLKDVWMNENLNDGLYVYLEIADSGCGMDKETLAKLFDPFFTTKFTGRGLGMAAVLGIVRGHKGAIRAYSEPGKGTSFKVLLPASGRPADLFNHVHHPDEWHGSGTVLLVDDEETVRGIGAEMLKELGFAVITANDGREAVAAFQENRDIRFVILDLTMPHMDGEQCFRRLRQLKPDVKVIMSSGYNEQEVTQRFVGKGLAGFIQKPYRLSTLQEVIRTVAY